MIRVTRLSRRGAGAVLAAALAVSLAACSPSTEPTPEAPETSDPGSESEAPQPGAAVTVALLLPDTQVARYEQYDRPYFEEGLAAACPECTLIYSNADADPARQRMQAEDAITNGADAIVINPVDSDAAAGIAATAEAAGVPLISIGRLVQDADVAWSITMDVAEAGRLKAQSLVDALVANGTPQGPIVMINGAPGDTDDAQMKAAAHEVFTENDVEIAMEYDTPNWDPSRAQEQMDQAIIALGADGFTGVYSSNDGMAGGAIAAMKSAGIDPATRPITGLDADIAALQRIIIGEQHMTVFQDIRDMAHKAAEIAAALGAGQEPDPSLNMTSINNGLVDVPAYLFRIAAVTRDNINEELFVTEMVDVSLVCSADYAAACTELGIDF